MHAISSYRGNRHRLPATNTQTHRQDRLQYTAPLASAQCKNQMDTAVSVIELHGMGMTARMEAEFAARAGMETSVAGILRGCKKRADFLTETKKLLL